MTLFERVRTPSFAGATGWLNSEPLGPAELEGHVVLVNFWTLTCINWLRQEPYVRSWSQAYRDDGLIVIGVHTPEFSFEHEIGGIWQTMKARAIDYPVAVDNDYAVWSAFANRYWPALYFIDKEGIVRDQQFGEGRYEQSERVIQRLLGVERELVPVEGVGVEAPANWHHLRTPETYLGYGRSERFASANGASFDKRRTYKLPDACRSTTGRSPETGRSGPRMSCSTRPAAGSPTASTHEMLTWCCLVELESRSPSACSSTARLQARHEAWTSTNTETAFFARAACISWCASTMRSASERFKSRSSSQAPRPTRSRSGSAMPSQTKAVGSRERSCS
jgi:thiol-disulfide isomerase/thioredoxin